MSYIIYQSEAAECGLACMAMVANHHGHQLDLTTLHNRYSVSLKGANLSGGGSGGDAGPGDPNTYPGDGLPPP